MVQLLVGGPQCNCHAKKKKRKKSEYECAHTINVWSRVSVWLCTYQSAHITTSKWPSSAETSDSQSHLTTLWNTESRVEEPIELLVLRLVLRDTTFLPPHHADTRRLSASLEPWMKCDGGKRCHLPGKGRQLLTWHLTFIPCEHAHIETRTVWPRTSPRVPSSLLCSVSPYYRVTAWTNFTHPCDIVLLSVAGFLFLCPFWSILSEKGHGNAKISKKFSN